MTKLLMAIAVLAPFYTNLSFAFDTAQGSSVNQAKCPCEICRQMGNPHWADCLSENPPNRALALPSLNHNSVPVGKTKSGL